MVQFVGGFGTSAPGAVAALCYSGVFASVRDPWTLLHFIDGAILELFLDNWTLSFTVMALFEMLEASLLTLFGNYVFFGTTANEDFETCTAQTLGDGAVNLLGILVVTMLRYALGARLPPLWPRTGGWPSRLRALVQLLVVYGVTAAALSVGLNRLPPGDFFAVHWGVLAATALYLLWYGWIAALPLWNGRFYRDVWKARHAPYSGWPFGALAAITCAAAALPAAALPYTFPSVVGVFIALLLVFLVVHRWC